MIKQSTTFVVGAGASFDYGFPLGPDLTKQIANALNFVSGNSSRTTELMRTAITLFCHRPEHRRNSNELFQQARLLRAGLVTASSIDSFLENRSDNLDFELLGKMAIAACLTTAEQQSTSLKPRHPGEMIDLSKSDAFWLARLFKLVMAPGAKPSAIEEIFEKVSFIVFNYDRCIEHYFEHAIASHFTLDLGAAATIVQKHLEIVHPYGAIGALHGTDANVSFGYDQNPESHAAGVVIYEMAERLLTFTESQKVKVAPEAQAMIEQAKRLVFLGFGFGEQNMELIRPRQPSSVEDVRATVKFLSKSNQHEVQQRISTLTGGHPPALDHLLDCDCATLISDEQMFLTR